MTAAKLDPRSLNAAEMPWSVRRAISKLREMKLPDCDGAADDLANDFGTHAAQPAKAPPSYDVLMSILYSLATKEISVGKAQKILMQWATGEKVDDFAGANEEAVHAMMFGDGAQPAPAVAMSPELERVTIAACLHAEARRDFGYKERAVEILRDVRAVRSQAAEAGKVRMPAELEALLRTFASGLGDGAQAAPAVAMTPALEKVLESAELAGKHYDDWSLLSAVVAVRQEVTQAAEAGKGSRKILSEALVASQLRVEQLEAGAGKVRMPAELEALLRTFASGQGINVARLREVCRAVFAEPNASEGRK